MTIEYIRLLEAADTVDNPFFRMSTKDSNLSLRMDDRRKAADIIDAMIDDYPDTVLYSKLLNDWVHRTPAIHTIDPQTGLATDCAYIGADWHRGYGFDLEPLKGKRCCAPEFDCGDCRVGPVATFSLMMRLAGQMRRSKQAQQDLLELRTFMMRYYFGDAAPATDPIADQTDIAAVHA